MKLSTIAEPLLEFGNNTHVCPKAGISLYDVYDTRSPARRDRILVGAVGTSADLETLGTWLQACAQYIPGKDAAQQPTLFAPFCGFHRESGFQAEFLFSEELARKITPSQVRDIVKVKGKENRIEEAVILYHEEVKFLAQHRPVDVIICVIPKDLHATIAQPDEATVGETIEPEDDDLLETDFRRALKARTMSLGKPLQLLLAASLVSNAKGQEDDATKAWNLCTALYYKASQTVPWRLVPNHNRTATCFAGICFYRTRDKAALRTSLAQIFDELGNGVILRGTPVDVDKTDRQPHLSEHQAFSLLQRAFAEYRIAVKNPPARMVVHKTSNYNAAELDGLRAAANAENIHEIDFVTILDTPLRLFRDGSYPPYRGSLVELDATKHVLYTRGSVAYYKTYPGKYVPAPLEVRIVESDESPRTICEEILGLTKMNWNRARLDGKYPITIECARKVGQIMKYIPEHEAPQVRYAFYM